MLDILAGAFMTATRSDGFGPREGFARHTVGGEAASGFADRLAGALRAMTRRVAERNSALGLRDLDDALLRDIGLTRDEADRLSRSGRLEDAGLDPRGRW